MQQRLNPSPELFRGIPLLLLEDDVNRSPIGNNRLNQSIPNWVLRQVRILSSEFGCDFVGWQEQGAIA